MCGTWNFTTAEDFTKRDGSLAANSVDFGDDWKVQPSVMIADVHSNDVGYSIVLYSKC